MPVLSKFPYFSQLDNARNPYGSCNVTSISMCLSYLGIVGNGNGQLEDQMYDRCAAKSWSRHDPFALKKLAESYPGVKDELTTRGKVSDIIGAIDKGKPCVLHGYFTKFGHIIVVKGYDSKGLIVNDPYGEWMASGYDTQKTGEGLNYSYKMIARVCSPESVGEPHDIWFHALSRG